MSWIHIVSHRYKCIDHVNRLIDLRKSLTAEDLRHIGPFGFIDACMSQDKSIIDRFNDRYLEDYYSLMVKIFVKSRANLPFLHCIIPASILKHVMGDDQKAFWEELLAYESDDPRAKNLHDLIHTMLFGEIKQRKKRYRGLSYDEQQVLKLIDKVPYPVVLDSASCIDHPLYSSILADYIFPAAYILSSSAEQEKDFLNLVSGSSMYESHSDVIYQRSQSKPDYRKIDFNAGDSSTWPDFDAMEIVDGKLKIYHWVGFDPNLWTITYDVENDMYNALVAWEHRLESLELVKRNVSEETMKIIKNKIDSGKVEHIIVYNQRDIKNLLEEEIEKYQEHYGVKVRCCEMMDV